jgi:hypothetical protein
MLHALTLFAKRVLGLGKFEAGRIPKKVHQALLTGFKDLLDHDVVMLVKKHPGRLVIEDTRFLFWRRMDLFRGFRYTGRVMKKMLSAHGGIVALMRIQLAIQGFVALLTVLVLGSLSPVALAHDDGDHPGRGHHKGWHKHHHRHHRHGHDINLLDGHTTHVLGAGLLGAGIGAGAAVLLDKPVAKSAAVGGLLGTGVGILQHAD